MGLGVKQFGNPVALVRLSADPVSAVDGTLYYNTTSHKVRQRINGAFQDVAGGSVSLTGQTLAQYRVIVGNSGGTSAAVDSNSVGDILVDETNGLTIKSGVIVNADINASAAIAVSKLAALTASRVVATDGSGFLAAQAYAPGDVILRAGTVAFTGNVDVGANRVTNAANAVGAQDLVTLSQVEGLLDGRSWKQEVRVATIANIDLSSAPAAVDGITLSNGDRVLVKNQSAPAENGIYVFTAAAAAMTRSSDANTALELQSAAVSVASGTAADKQFYQTADSITLGTTAIAWVIIGSNVFAGHDMITISGNDISVDLATTSGLESSNPGNAAGQLRVKLEASNPTLRITGSNELAAKLDAAGAVQTGASGLLVGVDDSTIERNTNALRVKALGIDNSHIATAAAIARSKLASGTANRVLVNNGSGVMTDAAAITASRALISDANGIPTHSTVTDTELGYVSGVTSAIQTQLGGKASTALSNLAAVAINTSLISDTNNTDDLGSDAIEWKDLYVHSIKHGDATNPALTIGTTASNGNLLLQAHGTGHARIQATLVRRYENLASSNWVEQQYIHASTLAESSTGVADSNLTFAHASYSGMIVTYRIVDTVNSRSRTGTLRVTTNGTDVEHDDDFTQTGDVGVTWETAINGANVEVRYTTTANDKTARYDIKRLLA